MTDARSKRVRRAFTAALVVLVLARGLAWFATYPVFKVADEPAHFDNIQYRAEHRGRAPVENGEQIDKVMSPTASRELRQAWSATNHYWRDNFIRNRLAVPEELELQDMALEPESRETHGQMTAMGYPGLYYTLGIIPYQLFHDSSILTRVFAIRALSLLFGLMAVLFTFYAALLAVDSEWLAFAAAVFVCLQPMESQMTTGINNDAAVIGLCAALFYVQLRLLTGAELPSSRWGAVLGAIAALAILSKPHGYGMLPGCLFVLLLLSVRHPGWRTLRLCAVALVTFAAVRSVPAMVDLLGPSVLTHRASAPHAGGFHLPPLLAFPSWVDDLPASFKTNLFHSAWGAFSWLDFSFADPWFEAIGAVLPGVWVGAAAAVVIRTLSPPNVRLWWRTNAVAFSAATAGCGFGFILFLEYFAQTVIKVHAIQGRAFLFVAPAFAICGVVSLGSLVPARLRPFIAGMIVTGSIALNLGALVTVMRFQYVK